MTYVGAQTKRTLLLKRTALYVLFVAAAAGVEPLSAVAVIRKSWITIGSAAADGLTSLNALTKKHYHLNDLQGASS